VEVYNPTGSTVDLSRYHLSDMTTYHLISGGISPGSSDFAVHFPGGATIPPGGVVVVSLESATSFSGSYGFAPDFDLDPIDAGAAAMVGPTGPAAGLTNGAEVLVLFHWDGSSDLVSDVDYVLYGDVSNAVDKSGTMVGASTYLPDTAAASQDFVAAPASGMSAQRVDPGEGMQVQSGGNGILGANETSEDLSVTWTIAAPTPGTVSFIGPTSVPLLSPVRMLLLACTLAGIGTLLVARRG
jgi:hypothetical protein